MNIKKIKLCFSNGVIANVRVGWSLKQKNAFVYSSCF